MPQFRIRLTASAPVEGWITVEADDAHHARNTVANWVVRHAQGDLIAAVDAVQWNSMGYPASEIEVMTEADDIYPVIDTEP